MMIAPALPTPGVPATGSFRGKVALTICFLIALIDGYDTLMLAFIAPLISRDWAMPPGEFGKIFAAGYAGAALGAFLAGLAADRFGRRKVLALSLAIAGSFTLACAMAQSPAQLTLLRLLAGIGLGGAIPAVSALAAECVAPERRARIVARVFLGFPVGAMVGGAVTATLMHAVGWRGIFVAGGAVALVLLPLTLAIAEAPRPAAIGGKARRPLAEVFAEGRAAGTVLLCAAVFLTLLVTYFLLSWTPTVLSLNGMPPARAALATAVLNLGGVVGTLMLSFLIGSRNPFLPVAIAVGLGALLVPLFGVDFFNGAALPGFGLSFVVGLLILGAQINIPALCVFYYPAHARATGVGLSMAVGRLGSIVGPLAGGLLVAARLPWSQLFLITAVPALAAAVAMWLVYRGSRRT